MAQVVIVFIFIAIVAVAVVLNDSQKQKKFKQARLDYATSLEQFRRNPANSDLRREAISFGQIYADLATARKSPLFSELILQADIGKIVYEYSLEKLKADPSNSDLRQKTLHVGRKYARVVREDGRETLFDEMALMNDINAVSSGSVVNSKQTVSQRLQNLQELKEQGLITDDEYNTKRSAILDEM